MGLVAEAHKHRRRVAVMGAVIKTWMGMQKWGFQ